MRAKIRHRADGRWYVATVTDDGVEHAHGGFATQREAKAKASALVTDSARGRYVAPGGPTVVGYLLGEWLPSRENADISPGTRATDGAMVRAWIVPHVGSIPLQRLSARDLDRLYATLRASGGRNGRSLRGKSVRNVHALLSKALGDAVRRGHLVVNPILAVDPPARDDSVERKAWTAEQARTFLEAASGDRLAAVWRLALTTGCRRGELLGLQWTDVGGTGVRIGRQVHAGGFVRLTTKTRRVRTVRIDPATTAALQAWKAAQARERLKFGPAWRTDGGVGVEGPWVVTEPDGYVVHPDTLSARWKRLAKAAGVPVIPFHGARHSYAMVALGAGARLDMVSRQLGHASISTTANVYGHDDPDAAQVVADLLGAALGEERGDTKQTAGASPPNQSA